MLHGLISLELSDESLVLLIGNLCRQLGIVFYLTEVFLVLQEIHGSLKTDIQF